MKRCTLGGLWGIAGCEQRWMLQLTRPKPNPPSHGECPLVCHLVGELHIYSVIFSLGCPSQQERPSTSS